MDAIPHKRDFLDFGADFSERCANAFYEELFEFVPGARELFHDRERQSKMFAQMLTLIVEHSERQPERSALLRKLGKMHQDAGVTSVHFKTGRFAFINAIEKSAPIATAEEMKFFCDAYDEVTAAMV